MYNWSDFVLQILYAVSIIMGLFNILSGLMFLQSELLILGVINFNYAISIMLLDKQSKVEKVIAQVVEKSKRNRSSSAKFTS